VRELSIVVEGESFGRVHAEKGGRLSLEYETRWRESPEGHSLSVSMPLSHAAYSQKSVLPYLWNLLPENPTVLQRWAQYTPIAQITASDLLVELKKIEAKGMNETARLRRPLHHALRTAARAARFPAIAKAAVTRMGARGF
jgi:HipA-like protein